MAKGSQPMIELECPCCEATLKVDPATGKVITYKAKEKPPSSESWSDAMARVKGEASRREDAFRKSQADLKTHKDVLNKKFDELLKQTKENPNAPRPQRDIDLD
jgi:hypothetical protein